MRTLELAIAFAILFAVWWPALFGVRPKRGLAAGILLTVILLHWRFEGLRWQMLPMYLLAVGLSAGDLFNFERDMDWTRRISRGIFGSAGVGLSVLLPILLPVPVLPVPSGPQEVGTFSIEIVHPDREEFYGGKLGEPRRIMTQVWYPANPLPEDDPEVWSQDWDVVAPAMAKSLGFPGWFLNHTQYVNSHSYENAPPAPGTYPVVVYSHGWTGFRTIGINQIENLVSNGYVVVSLDHTYGSIATRFEDGEVVEWDPAALPDAESVSEEEYQEAATVLVETFAADLVLVLDELEAGRTGAFARLEGSIDLSRIGLFGHSTGGGAAVQACITDVRCNAVLGFDPWVEPLTDKVVSEDLTKPAMFLRSDEWRGNDNDAQLRGIAERSKAVAYWVGIDGAGHNDFVLTPLFSPAAHRIGLKGPIPAGRIIPILDRYLVGFFDVFLLGTGPPAIDTASFPEVSVEIIRP